MEEHNYNDVRLTVEFHIDEHIVVVDGVKYPIQILNGYHPLLSNLNRKQLFDFAFDLGAQVVSYQYGVLIKRFKEIH